MENIPITDPPSSIFHLRSSICRAACLVALVAACPAGTLPARPADIQWRHLSSRNGDLPVPGESTQQTGALVADLDRDGVNDFVLSFRQVAPALVWYRRGDHGWQRLVIEKDFLTVEAGGAAFDIDGDGDLDVVFGGDWQSKEVWWWENPAPNFDPNVPWKRHMIKKDGATQHHDQVFGDFKGTGRAQLAFWNQGAKTIFLADIPDDPRHAGPWPRVAIFSGQAGETGDKGAFLYAEGMAAADVDGDGKVDLLAGNYWFKHTGGNQFMPIKVGTIGGRILAGRLKPGKYLQLVIAPGDGVGPLRWYECSGQPTNSADWVGHDLAGRDLVHGHSLALGDIDGDGHLDIFAAEMAKWHEKQTEPDNPKAAAWIFFGDGQGHFRQTELVTGHGFHEARVADLDGDGDLDILNKPYNWEAPRVDVWLNNGTGSRKGIGAAGASERDILLADFEGRDYGDWKATGEAFGSGPAGGALPNQQPVSGFLGKGLVNSFRNGDRAQGTLTSPEFGVDRKFINFLVGGGAHVGETCVNLLVGGKTVRTTTGNENERLDWATWDVGEFAGKVARVEIVDKQSGGWGHINVDQIVQSDTAKAEVRAPLILSTAELYNETYRPQFHFTAQKGWLNDPNGLVFYAGEYHLFFQHNPLGVNWGNMTWGHAVSPDLMHWQQLAHALEPDALGTMFSGSAVVDWHNTAGFQDGPEKTLVAIYTAAGGTSDASKGRPFTQCIAYSNDRGRTWKKFDANPVLKNITEGNRDPKVFWHEPTRRWIMALYVDAPDGDARDDKGKSKLIRTIQFFGSPDLKNWTYLSRVDHFFECPDLFELPVDGDRKETRWVLFGADGNYLIGRFDGTTFTKESGKHTGDWGRNFYAAQTYSDIPAADGRRILIGWMTGGKYPSMPFNQQMTFPAELTLHRGADGLRLHKLPVHEITGLHAKTHAWKDTTVMPGENPLATLSGDLFDTEAEIEPGEAKEFGFTVRGTKVIYSVADKKLSCLGKSADLAPVNQRIRLRLLVDRTSLELFANEGRVVFSSCFLPRPDERALAFFAVGGPAKLTSLHVHELKSAWSKPD
jgi:sucrose-6-phosphate hydrolase SacC (GH32 family)